jgi:hypothetical protein
MGVDVKVIRRRPETEHPVYFIVQSYRGSPLQSDEWGLKTSSLSLIVKGDTCFLPMGA